MIISASYKTDIPAFYADWFQNRLAAGYCKIANPFNRSRRYTVSLRRQDVDGFVFWTKNLAPFMSVLKEVRDHGYPFIVQYTINGYPRSLESRVVDATASVQHIRTLADIYGPRVAVWRYDTIIFTTDTDANFHRRNFDHLARQIAGATDEVVVSFMQIYDKTRRNMNEAARKHDFEWEDPPASTKQSLLRDLLAIAADYNMRLSICTQPDLIVDGVSEARCVDALRLTEVAGRSFQAGLKGMRKGCGCFESKDIGDYDTCPHGCVYCYAVRNRSLALSRYKAHDPRGEYLFPQEPEEPEESKVDRLPLFPEEDR